MGINTMKTSFSMTHLLLLLLFCCLNCFSNADTDAFLTCLSSAKLPQSIIYTTQTKNYTFLLQDHIRNSRFNTSTTPKPVIILTPTDEPQIQQLVKCATQTGMELRTRSGGHDYEGLSYTSNSSTPFAVLDMFNLRSIEVDIANATAWVQTGATIGELYYRIWEKSKVHAFPAGVCPTMGVGGHFSGGGYGNLMRKYGISVDNVVDARVADANARVLDRKAMGEDLFWAIRGGGGSSFGVVLAYKVNLVPVPANVTVFSISKTLDQNATEILHRWQFVATKFDKELYVRVNIVSLVPKVAKVTFLSMYLGSSDNLLSTMRKQFPELGVKKEDCMEMSWIRAAMVWAEFPKNAPETVLLARNPGPSTFKIKSDYVKNPISVAGIDGLLRRIQAEGTNFFVKFNPYGGRMSEIPANATPFPHRAGNIFKIQYFLLWEEPGPVAEAKNLKRIRKVYDYMTPFVSQNPRSAFLNYRDLDIGSTDNGPNAYKEGMVYGIKYFEHNFDRLVKIKTVVDPTNFFRNEQSVPTLPK